MISNKSDDNAFLRIVNFPTRGIGARTIEQLQDVAKKNNYSLWDAAKENESQNENLKKGIPFFVKLIKSIEDEIQGCSIAQSIEILVARSGLKDHYLKDKDGIDRISNLEELVSAAVTFIETTEIENEALNLVEFLNYTSLESGELQASATDDALQLMTIHSSKGLEFEVVFISGLEDGLCPHEQSLSEDGLEEERRLMYVAVTRAKTKLYLTLAQSRMLHGQTRYNVPSRFLTEIPDQLIKKLNSMNQVDILSNPIQTDFTSSKQEIEIGSTVLHPKFGQGIVTSYEGSEDDLRIQIRFKEHGVKWLAMEFAKLTTI